MANEFKYSFRKSDGNWRFFRQLYSLYPSALVFRVMCQRGNPIFLIDAVVSSKIPMVMTVKKCEKRRHYEEPTTKLWYECGEACDCSELAQRSRGQKQTKCWVSVNNKGMVWGLLHTALYICVTFFSNSREGRDFSFDKCLEQRPMGGCSKLFNPRAVPPKLPSGMHACIPQMVERFELLCTNMFYKNTDSNSAHHVLRWLFLLLLWLSFLL